jgi:orotate phosphoribosyltransferase
VQYVQHQLGLQVCAIARLADLLHYLTDHAGGELSAHFERVLAYRQRYGVA